MATVRRIIECMLAVVFLTSAFDKAIHVEAFRRIIGFHVPAIDRWSRWTILIVLVVVLTEGVVGTFLLLSHRVRTATLMGGGLLVLFTAFLGLAAMNENPPPLCGCGGVISVLGEWVEQAPNAIIRNFVLIVMLSVVLVSPAVEKVDSRAFRESDA